MSILTMSPPQVCNLMALNDSFDKVTIERGRKYAELGNAKYINWYEDECKINAEVVGSGHNLYEVSIKYNPGSKIVAYRCKCTCPVGYNCKHAVATILALQEQITQTPSKTNPTPLPDLTKLDYATTEWLNELLTEIKRDKPFEQQEEILFYLLDTHHESGDENLLIKTIIVKQLKKGGLGKPRDFYPGTIKQKSRITQADLEIYTWLDALSSTDGEYGQKGVFTVRNHNAAQLIPKLLKTKRSYWQSQNSKPLQQGEKIQAEIRWVAREDGMQVAQCFVDGKNIRTLPTLPLSYIDIESATIGPVITELPANIAAALVRAPAIEAMYTKQLSATLQKQISKTVNLPLPHSYQEIKQITKPPTPYLQLSCQTMSHFLAMQLRYEHKMDALEGDEYLAAQLYFIYDDMTIPSNDNKSMLSYIEDDQLIVRYRDKTQEIEHAKLLGQLNLDYVDDNFDTNWGRFSIPHKWVVGIDIEPESGYAYHQNFISALEAKGWKVEYDADYPYRQTIEVDEWYTELNEQSENDWFSMELGVIVDGERINLLPPLIKAMQSSKLKLNENADTNDTYILQLPEGAALRIPYERIRGILSTLTELLSPKYLDDNGQLTISRQRASVLIELEKAFAKAKLRWFGDDKLRKLAKKLKNFSGIKQVKIPSSFHAELRNYQLKGVSWLQFLREYQFNGILADDMGLGKTIQALAHLLIEKHSGRLKQPCLIVAPTSVIANWQLEAKRFTPDNRCSKSFLVMLPLVLPSPLSNPVINACFLACMLIIFSSTVSFTTSL